MPDSKIKEKVSRLPEIYQPIFGFPSLSGNNSRSCSDRLESILRIGRLLKENKKKLRLLDLGCAQGFFSFSLAQNLGAEVVGIDYLKENIDVCNELKNYFGFDEVEFYCGDFDVLIPELLSTKFDIVLGLSVFHHFLAEKGERRTEDVMQKLANNATIAIFELAVKEEGLYWSKFLPKHPYSLISPFVFRITIEYIPTHLTSVKRPLVFASNNYVLAQDKLYAIEKWKDKSYEEGVKFGKFFIFSKEYFITVVKKECCKDLDWSSFEQDYDRELTVSSSKISSIQIPNYYFFHKDPDTLLIVRELISGSLLYDVLKLKELERSQRSSVMKAIYDQLIGLSKEGLYHSDVRSWNILLTENGPRLIDFSSISEKPKDLVWPYDLNLALNALFNQIEDGIIFNDYKLMPVTTFISSHNPYSEKLLTAYSEGSSYETEDDFGEVKFAIAQKMFVNELGILKSKLQSELHELKNEKLAKLTYDLTAKEKCIKHCKQTIEAHEERERQLMEERNNLLQELKAIKGSRGYRGLQLLRKYRINKLFLFFFSNGKSK